NLAAEPGRLTPPVALKFACLIQQLAEGVDPLLRAIEFLDEHAGNCTMQVAPRAPRAPPVNIEHALGVFEIARGRFCREAVGEQKAALEIEFGDRLFAGEHGG